MCTTSAGPGSSVSSYTFPGNFITVEVDAVRDRRLGDIARAERDGTCAETRFRLYPKRTSPFKLVGGVSSVDCWQPRFAHQLEVMLDIPRSEVAWEYWLHIPFATFPFTSPPVRHCVPPGSERALPQCLMYRCSWRPFDMPLLSTCFTDEVFSGKKENFQSYYWTLDYRDFAVVSFHWSTEKLMEETLCLHIMLQHPWSFLASVMQSVSFTISVGYISHKFICA